MSSTRTDRTSTKARILRTLSDQMAEIQREGVCARIAQARREAGVTQQDMADLLDITMRAYQTYESERIPWRRLNQIAEATGKSKAWLLHGKEEQPSPDVVSQTAELLAAIHELTAQVSRLADLSGNDSEGGAAADAGE